MFITVFTTACHLSQFPDTGIFLKKKELYCIEGIYSVYTDRLENCSLNLLKPAGYVMHQQFNIQQLHVLPTLYLCVLYLSENKQRLVPLTV